MRAVLPAGLNASGHLLVTGEQGRDRCHGVPTSGLHGCGCVSEMHLSLVMCTDNGDCSSQIPVAYIRHSSLETGSSNVAWTSNEVNRSTCNSPHVTSLRANSLASPS